MNAFSSQSDRRAARAFEFFQLFLKPAALALAALMLAIPTSAQLPPPARGTDAKTQPAPNAPRDTNPPYLPPPSDDIVDEGENTPDIAPTPVPTPKVTPKPKPKNPKTQKPKSLTVGGVSIRGLSDAAAIKKLRRAHRAKLRQSVTLWDGRSRHRLRRDYLGASIPYYKLLNEARRYQKVGGNIPLRLEVDESKTQRAMKYLASKINHAPSDASLDVDASGRVLLRGGAGAELAVKGSTQRIKAALEKPQPQGYVELVIVRQPGTSTLRRFTHLLAEYSTPYDSGIVGRTNNLRMAARNVDGTIVEAGKTFSTNKAIGPRTGAGWREAKMFVNGQVVDGVGAGVCQCSTTIYNAALLANLPVTERYPHSFRVNYAPASRDAAIYWGQKDMKFKNTTGGPIYVQTFLKGERFHARLYGTKPLSVTVKVESRIISKTGGTRSEAYRIVESDNGTTRRRLSRDYYRPKKS